MSSATRPHLVDLPLERPAADDPPLDLVFIEGFVAHTVIGIHHDELHATQPIQIDLQAGVPRPRACDTDRIVDTIDYGVVRERLHGLMQDHGVTLLEAFAEKVAQLLLVSALALAPTLMQRAAPGQPVPVWLDLWARMRGWGPAFEALRVQQAWAGYYEVHPLDHNALIGPHPQCANFWLCNGFSGHGLQHAPAAGRGLAEALRFELEDYRHVEETFDRIVSVGMFEHVGRPFYDQYFKQAAKLLKKDGVMLMHTIGRTDEPTTTNPFIDKFIFPGGYIPSLSEVMPAIERSRCGPYFSVTVSVLPTTPTAGSVTRKSVM